MKNKIIKDALALTLITLVAGVALGGVYEITKDPIARQEAQAKAEAYEQVFTDAAAFEEIEMDDTLIQTIRDQLDQEGYKAQSIEEVMRAEDQSGETLGYAFTVVTSEGYGGDIQFSMGVQNDGTLNGISILSIGETAGLGMNADTPAFKDQFVGKQVEKLQYTKNGATQDDEINAISGATVTTNAMTNGVNAGLCAFRVMEGGDQ
ncbi:RnfABCDGE type electron transport complex subunit G [Blautia sp. BX19]|jgi:Na+-translocating ferredoxin:NAD+ oxidoreductase subunit G|nr:RnfABCDGE type electron transport complex subunit G [Blautia tarda]RGF13758.1 RnfABCDGE type electron transport complex subunit G [Blautia sp. AM16-16B]RHQ62870.1 RnfABCDGE type electron transport complex subunit G [Blautia sp. AF25-12LB]RHQ76528.1 RnfABCDGE type electron transport complex subunit G [Blautia sp. AF22-5LB]RHR19670.1 RnfABCDGE type electron transport complex subunit G [Blautia sp. AF19-34]RHS50877.1 RnfABCDGE type electron transport complex subunit G [Blautia sp. AM46-5]RHS5